LKNFTKALRIRSTLFLIRFVLTRKLTNWWAKPNILGAERLQADTEYCYVLNEHSITDLAILDQSCKQLGLTQPSIPMSVLKHHYFFLSSRKTLFRSARGARTNPMALSQLNEHIHANLGKTKIYLLPVSVFWSHAPDKERSLFKLLFSERWRVTSRLRRVLALLINRNHITVQFGNPVGLHTSIQESVDIGLNTERQIRRDMRILRVCFKKHRTAFLGPDRSHRRTLLTHITESDQVRTAIEASESKHPVRLAHKYANTIVSDISTVNVRFLYVVLSWFWNKIYAGIEVNGLARVARVAESSSIVYVPAHRSHIDYLLLGYLLYSRGLQLPHVAAGDNLNIPVIGGILRRAGAFYMRRSFRDDPLYAAVFREYFGQLLTRGHAMKYFVEGGRSRTGRLLPAKAGLLNMTIETQKAFPEISIVLVPVYIGYEKLIEANSYLKELRGERKTRESIADLFRNIRLIRQSFGKVYVNFGAPIPLAKYLEDHSGAEFPDTLSTVSNRLGKEILIRINAVSAVNPVNLVAVVTLCTPKLAIDEHMLSSQIDLYLHLLGTLSTHHTVPGYSLPSIGGTACVEHVEALGMLRREEHEAGDIMHLDNFSGVLFTWYRNNILHTLALPALIACFIVERHHLSKETISDMITTVYPYLAQELNMPPVEESQIDFWLDCMCEFGLIELQKAENSLLNAQVSYAPPEPHSHNYYQLDLLSRLIMQTLERFYIVVGLLNQAGSGVLDLASLENKCIKVAERISRLYGLNAPEFFDKRLFHGFLDALLKSDAIKENASNKLEFSEIIPQVCMRASRVIRKEFRYAVLRTRQ